MRGTLHVLVCLFHRRSLGVRSEENERWQSQSYSFPHQPDWLVVWERRGAQRRPARTSSGGRCAVRSGPATAGKSQRANHGGHQVGSGGRALSGVSRASTPPVLLPLGNCPHPALDHPKPWMMSLSPRSLPSSRSVPLYLSELRLH